MPPTPERLWRTVYVIAAAFVIIHGLRAAVPVADFWWPCFAEGHDSAACAPLQDGSGPSIELGAVHHAWLVGVGTLAISVPTAWGHWAAVRRGLFALGLVLVLGNLFASYYLTPLINGGYSSHDDHPGLGMTTPLMLVIAGLLLLHRALVPPRSVSTAEAPAAVATPAR